jgi:hypothetical protein
MKTIFILALLVSIRNPASSDNQASASLALGNIEAIANKTIENNKTCFDVKMNLKSVSKNQASWNNWNVTAYDAQGKSYQVETNGRSPATSEGGVVIASQYYYEEYKNSLKTCIDQSQNITRLELTPNQLPYKTETMTLQWTH